MRFKRRMHLEKGHLDIAPLIDVIFLLLIFFMLTSSFIFQPGIRVHLPKALTSEILKRENLSVVITSDGKIYVDERPVSLEELNSRLDVIAKQTGSILIKADRNAPLGNVVKVWDMCRNSDIKKVNLATTQSGEF